MEENYIEINIGKDETIRLERIFLVNEYEDRSTGKPTFSKILGVCHEIKLLSTKEEVIAYEVAEKIASDKKLFPQMGADYEKRTIVSVTTLRMGNQKFVALEMMLSRLKHRLEEKCNFDDEKTLKKAQQESRKLIEKGLKIFDKKMDEALVAFDKIFEK